jgi:ATP-dependent Lon protease
LIPDENQRDLKEIRDNIKSDLDIRPVKWIDEVLEIALQRTPEPLEEEPTLETDSAKESDGEHRISAH